MGGSQKDRDLLENMYLDLGIHSWKSSGVLEQYSEDAKTGP